MILTLGYTLIQKKQTGINTLHNKKPLGNEKGKKDPRNSHGEDEVTRYCVHQVGDWCFFMLCYD